MSLEFERTIDELDILLTALDMYPMNFHQTFKLLQLNLHETNADDLSAALIQLKRKIAELDDDTRRKAWNELHNPFRHYNESRH